jgi:hypothetical protein
VREEGPGVRREEGDGRERVEKGGGRKVERRVERREAGIEGVWRGAGHSETLVGKSWFRFPVLRWDREGKEEERGGGEWDTEEGKEEEGKERGEGSILFIFHGFRRFTQPVNQFFFFFFAFLD